MARRIILDTGTIIAIERGKLDVDAVLGADDAAIASVTAMELLVGVERADDAHKQARSVRVEAVLASLPIEDYTIAVARIHARLVVVQAMSTGKQRSAYDLMIAATAAATSRILLTTDAKAEFNQLPGVRSEVISGH
jgi:tRNA(fMet)-specific endonuclease VapC